MFKMFFTLAFGLTSAISLPSIGQVIPANTAFFDYDFTATDQMTAQFGTRNADDEGNVGGDAAGQPNDNGGIFANGFDNRGPFVDGPLSGQNGFNTSVRNDNLIVDTAGGFAMEMDPSPTNSPTGNIFLGQPKLSVGDTVRLISELSFTKELVGGVETNSQFDNYYFGFRAGIGGGEFTPNQGVAHAFRYNLGTDNTTDSDSNIQAFASANSISSAGGSGDGNIAFGAVSSLGLDIANNDFDTDIFRIVTDAVVTGISASGMTFEITTSIEDEAGNVLGATPGATTITNAAFTSADDRISFAIRDGASTVGDPSSVKIHRLAAIFNPDDSAFELGDFDMDGDVDLVDLDQYNGNIGAAATGALAALDLNGNGTVDAVDFQQHYLTLVETSNGQKGTFAGDANLDGQVNVLGDAFTLVGNLNNPSTSWAQGDFNADGTINVLGDAFALVGNLGNSNQ